jgi:hypothetical protein
MDMRQLIKKSDKLILNKSETTPPPTEPIEMSESQDILEPVVEDELPQYIEALESDYIPERYHLLHSIANSGWQPSDVWRDIRVDDFCG